MGSGRKSFSREFKIETVRLVLDGSNNAVDIARDMGIHPNTLYRWIKVYCSP